MQPKDHGLQLSLLRGGLSLQTKTDLPQLRDGLGAQKLLRRDSQHVEASGG